jgi:hypothetical protein
VHPTPKNQVIPMWIEERMDSPIAASAAARAITKIAKMSPFNWRLSNRSENVTTKEKVIQSTSATEVKELSILNLHKKELAFIYPSN